MPKKVIRTSLSVVLLAVRRGAPTVLPTASASTGVLVRCTPSFAPSAGMKPRCRSGPGVIVQSTAAIASAGRVVALAADATKPTPR